jgi:hypothetical protein
MSTKRLEPSRVVECDWDSNYDSNGSSEQFGDGIGLLLRLEITTLRVSFEVAQFIRAESPAHPLPVA